MDIDFIKEFFPVFIQAIGFTLKFGLIGVVLSFIVGLICSVSIYFKVPILTPIFKSYIELSRNTPLLVQLFLLYFGLPKIGIVLSSEACAIIGLTFLGGSYMAEAIRSGLDSVGKGQIESGLSIGFNRLEILRYITLPQAFAVALPSILANVTFLIKETSVFSAVALKDLMYIAKDLIGLYYKTDSALFMLVVSYLIILVPISVIAFIFERRLKYAGFGN